MRKTRRRWKRDVGIVLTPTIRNILAFPCTNPVAAFPVRHLDVNRAYNAATGEQSNVLVQNVADRMWFDRKFIQVVRWENTGIPELNLSLPVERASAGIKMGMATAYQVTPQTTDCRYEMLPGVYNYPNCEEGFLPDQIEDTDGDDLPGPAYVHPPPSYGPVLHGLQRSIWMFSKQYLWQWRHLRKYGNRHAYALPPSPSAGG